MFAYKFFIYDVSVDQLDLDGLSLNQLAQNYYVPIEIMRLKFSKCKLG